MGKGQGRADFGFGIFFPKGSNIIIIPWEISQGRKLKCDQKNHMDYNIKLVFS